MKPKRKSEQLYDGITEIRDDLITLAGQESVQERLSPARFFHKKWLISAAACLAVLTAASILLFTGRQSDTVVSAHTIAEAEYPAAPPYPDTDQLTDEGQFSKAWDAWWDDRISRRRMTGYAASMDGFLEKSVLHFLSASPGENTVFSPVNIYIALGMLAELTDGNSRAQILDLLGSPDIQSVRGQVSDLWNANYLNDGASARIMANSVWLDEDIDYVPSTMQTLAKHYYASSYQGQMGSETFQQMLKDWLDQQTGGLLTEQIRNLSMLKEDTILTLASTIYFRGKWQYEFSPDQTKPRTFHAASGDRTCDFMHKNETAATYYCGTHFSAVSQTMGEAGSMWLILPDEGITVQQLLEDPQAMEFMISAEKWNWDDQKEMLVNLAVPKFDITSQFDLAEELPKLGITEVFDPQVSDFSPMAKAEEGVFLSGGEHAVRVAADEQGVTAAAYTVMEMNGGGMPAGKTVDFVLDRPFLFVITDAADLPLFAGAVFQP